MPVAILSRARRSPPLLAAFVLACSVTAASGGQRPGGTPGPPADGLTYDAAVQRALSANPRLVAARQRRAVALASRDVAAERVNPEFRVEFEKETPKEGYSIAVPWELGGKRSKRIAVADASIRTGDAELDQVAAEVQSDVRRAYIARFIAEHRRALLDDVQALAGRVLDAAQARFEAGGVPRLDVVQARLAVAEARNQAETARGEEDAARATLNALLAYPVDAPTPMAGTLDEGPPPGADAAMARARAVNTSLVLSSRRIEEERARLALAHALRTPDITPEATLTRRAEPEFDTGWRAAVGITLPLFTTHQAAVRVEEATLVQLTSEQAALEARLAGEIAAASSIAGAVRRQYLRYRDEIVPQAIEVERMAEDAYRLGQTGIAAYLQAVQSSRDVRLRALQSAADLQNALADLERAIGAPIVPHP